MMNQIMMTAQSNERLQSSQRGASGFTLKDYRLTKAGLTDSCRFIHDLTYELDKNPMLLVTTSTPDSSLKGRQVALANIWFKEIAEQSGESIGDVIAICKLEWGLHLATAHSKEMRQIVHTMLGPYNYEDKKRIIRQNQSWFPVLSSKGGLSTEDTGKYLNLIQVNYAEQGIPLSSINDEDLIHCKEANK